MRSSVLVRSYLFICFLCLPWCGFLTNCLISRNNYVTADHSNPVKRMSQAFNEKNQTNFDEKTNQFIVITNIVADLRNSFSSAILIKLKFFLKTGCNWTPIT